MKQALVYSLKVWLTNLAVAPMITLALLGLLSDNFLFGILFWYPRTMPACLLSSLMAGGLLFIAVYYVNKLDTTFTRKKAWLTLAGLCSSVFSIYLLAGSPLDPEAGCNILSFCIVSVLSIWFYKLGPVHLTVTIKP